MKKMSGVFVVWILLTGTVYTQAGDIGLIAFYESVFTQDEKDLYEYLIEELTDYIKVYPDSLSAPDACYLLARSYQARGQEYESLSACMQLLYLYPGYVKRQEALGFVSNIITTDRSFRSEQEKYTEIMNRPVSGVTRADRYYAYLDMMMQLKETRFYDWTLEALKTFVLQYPNDGRLDQVLKWMADVYLNKSDEWPASAAYAKLDYLTPSSPLLPETRLARAKLLYEELGAHEEAAAAFDLIVTTWPQSEMAPEAQYMSGKVYEDKIKDYEKAILSYRKLVDIYPQYAKAKPALMSIGELYDRRLDKTTEAIAAYNEFVEKYRTSPQGVDALTQVAELYERKLEDYARAAEYYSQVAQYYPTYDDAPDMLIKAGELCEDKLGDYKKAMGYYEMLINTFPEHKRARDAEKKIERTKEKMAGN